MKKKPDEEDVSLGLNLGVSVQLASLLARWQVQYQAPGRVNTANYKICQLDLGKETKREKLNIKKYPISIMSICWAEEQPERDFSQSHVHVIQGWSKVAIPQLIIPRYLILA